MKLLNVPVIDIGPFELEARKTDRLSLRLLTVPVGISGFW